MGRWAYLGVTGYLCFGMPLGIYNMCMYACNLKPIKIVRLGKNDQEHSPRRRLCLMIIVARVHVVGDVCSRLCNGVLQSGAGVDPEVQVLSNTNT
jgi:hypothetical protein